MWVFYQSQSLTCFRCGMGGHLVAACSAARSMEPSVFHQDDFSPLGGVVDTLVEAGSVAVPYIHPALSVLAPLPASDSSVVPVDPVALEGPAPSVLTSVVVEIHPGQSVSLVVVEVWVRCASSWCVVIPASVVQEACGGPAVGDVLRPSVEPGDVSPVVAPLFPVTRVLLV